MSEELSEYERRLDSPLFYSQRPHPLSSEVEFEIRPDRLSWTDARGRSGEMLLHDVVALRLSYDPARLMSTRHVLEVVARSGAKLRITSNTYRGMAQWRPRNRAFRRFVEQLHLRLAALQPQVDAQTGRGMLRFILQTGLWALMLVAMAIGVALSLRAGHVTASLILAGMSAYFAWIGFITARLNLPRRYPVGALPSDLLPQPSEADV